MTSIDSNMLRAKAMELGFRFPNEDAVSPEAVLQKQQKKREEQLLRQKAEEEKQRRYRQWKNLCEKSCHFFLKDSDWICRDINGSISSRALYDLYRQWCCQYRLPPHSIRALSVELKQNMPLYGAYYTQNIPLPGGGHARGFRGIRAAAPAQLPHPTDNTDRKESI